MKESDEMEYIYEPEGVCSHKIIFDIENNIIKSVKIIGGCPGNTVGLSKLLEGQNIDDVIKKLKVIPTVPKIKSGPELLVKLSILSASDFVHKPSWNSLQTTLAPTG